MGTKRKSISKRMRFEVFKRDRFSCQYCSAKPPQVQLEVDHIIPISKNGNNNKDNLITACFNCNRGKSNIELTDIPQPLIETIERKKEAQAQYAAYKRILNKERKIIASEIEDVERVYNASFEGYVFTDKFKVTVKGFISKLGIEQVEQAMDSACSRIYYSEQESLKYFCGICWNIIKEREQ